MASQRSPYPLIGSYNVQRDIVLDGERTINCYEVPASKTVQKVALVPASGLLNDFEVGDGPIRAQFVFKNFAYVVSGDEIYSVDTALSPTLLGSMNTSSGYVGITANEIEVIFVDGVDGFIWNTQTSTFSQITFGFSITPIDVTMLDNYFIIPDGDTIKWYISALNDGTSWDVTDTANFISNPDQLVAISSLKRRLYLFGKTSIEVWYDAGAADFPFRRDNNALFEHGCVAPKTVQEGFELLFYVARNEDGPAGVMMVEGVSNPRPISTKEIDIFLQNITNIGDGEAILYRENGLTFYQLSFTEEKQTFVYVVETDRWHELGLPDGERHPATAHVFFTDKHLIGMYDSNKIYEQSYKYFTYGGELIRVERIGAPFFTENHQRMRVDRFELETITGFPNGTLANQEIYDQLNDLIV